MGVMWCKSLFFVHNISSFFNGEKNKHVYFIAKKFWMNCRSVIPVFMKA